MKNFVEVEQKIPDSILIKGIHFQETKNLKLRQLILFIERDLFQCLKELIGERPEVSILQVDLQIPAKLFVDIKVSESKDKELVKKAIEEILWSYNRQELLCKSGTLFPLIPRFVYQLNVN